MLILQKRNIDGVGIQLYHTVLVHNGLFPNEYRLLESDLVPAEQESLQLHSGTLPHAGMPSPEVKRVPLLPQEEMIKMVAQVLHFLKISGCTKLVPNSLVVPLDEHHPQLAMPGLKVSRHD